MRLNVEEAKRRCIQYAEVAWEDWVWACRLDRSDPILDAFHEAYEQIMLQKIAGVNTLSQLLSHPQAELLNAASHSMACLLVANQFGDPFCPDASRKSPKCRYCALVLGTRP